MWVNGKQIQTQEWITVYYDNPDEVPRKSCVLMWLFRFRLISSFLKTVKG
jgi:hypothetical protein